jgi:predicted acyltransferase
MTEATKISGKNRAATAPVAAPPEARPLTPPARLASLDVFRGLTIAGMLLVNNPGTWSQIYGPLRHAEWHGWTPTDLVFPFFLFIVGVAMTFSYGKLLERGAGRRELIWKAFKRSAILFGIGLFLHGFPSYNFSTIRIPGVLQRIALASFLATIPVVFTRARGRAITAGVLLLGYWAIMTLVPVPEFGAGVLEPGKDLGAYVDRAVFGTAHLWKQSKTWDPEGLLSTIPAVGTVLLGVLVGHWVRAGHAPRRMLGGLVVMGVVFTLLGSAWGVVFPINKSLWTSSYTLFTAGLGSLTLAACYWLVDVKGYRRWALPFTVFGTNAIAAFFLSTFGARLMGLIKVAAGPEGKEIALQAAIYRSTFVPAFSAPKNASLAFALCYVLLWLGVMAILYRKRIFIKVG